jgi:hypothetical protein
VRVIDLVAAGPKRNSLYRWQVNKFIDEAKKFGNTGSIRNCRT